ncbi:putative component of the ubiquinol-cytochrome c reductase complex (complex III or cytochrome b-c1 complex), which is part of the mitochondrial respiratory chain [Lyophyllum shimeji]|uniref:Cytochrome b-c1 complex subunit 7 n=1 Tax=Lyophyllum shimeji TaxID=47721 RepID=A0A9P3PGZ1_LYOSH|nr:putative component of the ubiquinol-cytochrome c reductase complex (complex III or cytochrome b-c1 complex), which is part of the mitochondrial respiratory chain [Lyophyllum shimeji]
MVGPLSISLANYVKSSKTLSRWVKPIANWYANAAGYRKYGFKYDDLLVEERPDVQRALERLTRREKYDRAFRIKRASQASVLHKPLPKELWMKPEEDARYLLPHVVDVAKEDSERKMWDHLEVKRV